MAKAIVKKIIQLGGVDLKRYDKATDQYAGLYKKYKTFTMVPNELFISNLSLIKKFLSVKGDLVECGVWRGGMIASMSELAGSSMRAHLFDSFEGLPPVREIDGEEAANWQQDTNSTNYYENCTADESYAIDAMNKTGHSNYRIYKGWFNDTLALYDGAQISILRLDGDWYDSIKICLEKLFPLVANGGLIILDDYHTWDGCTKAVHDYLSEIKSPSRISQWNNQVAYIVKKS